MARIEEPSQDVERMVGRGREDATPVYLQAGVMIVVAIVVAVVVGLVFLAQALA